MIHNLTQYGQQIELDITTDPEMLIAWANDFEWQKYNPRKDVNRWGVSVTSLDGTFNGIDLDSLSRSNEDFLPFFLTTISSLY